MPHVLPEDQLRATVEARIRAQLAHCYDPRIALNIVDLGLVHSATVTLDSEAPGAGIAGVPPRYLVAVELLAASTGDDERAQLRAQVENLLAGLPEVSKAEVVVLEEPAWTPARISAAGRRQLKLDPVPFPILNQRLR